MMRLQVTTMPNPENEKKVTDSWTAHQKFLGAIQRFLAEIKMRDGEVWIGEVCLGSPNQPRVSAPLGRDSAALVEDSVRRAEALVTGITETLQIALRVTGETINILQGSGVVNGSDLAGVIERSKALETLLDRLTTAATDGPLACHPANLRRWFEILDRSIVPGNPAVEVRVVTTYVL